jgi:hypothetical protein
MAGAQGAETTETNVIADQSFSDAFDVATIEVAKEDRQAADAELSAIEDKPPEVPETPEVPEVVAEAPVVVPEKTWEDKERDYQARIQELEARPVTPATPAPAAPLETPKPEPFNEAAALASLSEAEKKALSSYDEEFDEISRNEGLKRKVAIEGVRAEFQNELKATLANLGKEIAPIITLAVEYGREKHFTKIREAHEDYEKLRDGGQIKTWIAKQPAKLKSQYEEWYSQGSTEDVINLVTLFKEVNKQPDPVVTQPPPKRTLSVVTTKRGPTLPGGAGKDDFGSAFDEAASRK